MKATLTDQLLELHLYILQTFVDTGQSPTLAEVKERFSLDTTIQADSLLGELVQTKMIHRERHDELVTHAYPFSNVPTPHLVTLESGVQVHAMCAVDALGIPFMLNQSVDIHSSCHQCECQINVRVESGKIAFHNPIATVVGYVAANSGCTPATDQCPMINFFCSLEHKEQWAEQQTVPQVGHLSLTEALEQGQWNFGSLMSGKPKCC